ncbi:hypothetical protein BGZ96_002916, partial [Linnemannia gamsii]
MKITYIAIAAAFAQVCIAGTVLTCTGEQDNVCRTFQIGTGDYYFCVCTASPSCQVGNSNCNSAKLQQCKNFCNTKLVCDPVSPCPYPTECSNLWIGGVKKYKCAQFI